MKDKADLARATVKRWWRAGLAFAAGHRFWIECAAVGAFALVALYFVGTAAQRRAAAVESEARRLEALRVGADRWITGAQPTTAAESALWRESDAELRSLASTAPLSVMHLVARRAEEVGVSNLRIGLASLDSVVASPSVAAGGWSLEPGPAAVAAELVGDWPVVLSFLGSLPPQVEVGDLTISGADGSLRARALLVTRQAVAP